MDVNVIGYKEEAKSIGHTDTMPRMTDSMSRMTGDLDKCKLHWSM